MEGVKEHIVSNLLGKATPFLMWKVLVTYKYKIHNFDLTDGSLVNMHILCLLQVVFSYFVKKSKNQKINKRVKSPKRKIKRLRKNNRPQKKKMIET